MLRSIPSWSPSPVWREDAPPKESKISGQQFRAAPGQWDGLHCGWNSSDPRVLSVAWHPLCFVCPGSWRPLWLLTCSDVCSPAHLALTHLIPTPSWLPCYHFERRSPYPTVRVRKVSMSCTLDPIPMPQGQRGHWLVPGPFRYGAEVTGTSSTNY